MYKISVPLMNSAVNRKGREKTLNDLKKCGVSRVFLAMDAYFINPEKRKAAMNELKENCKFFKENGFEVGAWIWTFMTTGNGGFQKMLSLEGESRDCCPLDENFIAFAGGYLMDIAECGVDLIMFDDDFRFGFRPGMHCVCEKHMELIRSILNENISAAELSEKIFTGGKNKFRDAFLKADGESLKLFARKMREYADKVNPNLRLGLCACMSTWDNDGIDAATLSNILAGKTKPFLRLIGAPYWANEKSWGNRLQNVVELSRMERSWCESGIEIFCEGDTYPRARHKTPSSYLELFDTAMRADGTTDGILKYMADYYSSPDYEKGYVDAHVRNKKLYEEIDKIFSNKEACGIRIYEKMNKLADMVIPKEAEGKSKAENLFFSVAGRMLSDCSVPSVYCGEGVCGIAFGENITAVSYDAMKKGVIIDAEAARILNQNGIDTGIVLRRKKYFVYEEYFVDDNEYVRGGYKGYDVKLKPDAEVKSYFICQNESNAKENTDFIRVPGSYIYENKHGHKFLVFNFDAYFNTEEIYRSYSRSRQISLAPLIFRGKKLPAYSFGNPDLYIMCKKGGGSMAVGLWNMFADCVYNPVVELDEEYKKIKFIGCEGNLKGNKVFLSKIYPFSFAGFEVS